MRMTKTTPIGPSPFLYRLGALAIFLVSGRVAYSLYLNHSWLTLAILGVKVCFTIGAFVLACKPHRTDDATRPVAPPSLLVILFLCASTMADLTVATLIR